MQMYRKIHLKKRDFKQTSKKSQQNQNEYKFTSLQVAKHVVCTVKLHLSMIMTCFIKHFSLVFLQNVLLNLKVAASIIFQNAHFYIS